LKILSTNLNFRTILKTRYINAILSLSSSLRPAAIFTPPRVLGPVGLPCRMTGMTEAGTGVFHFLILIPPSQQFALMIGLKQDNSKSYMENHKTKMKDLYSDDERREVEREYKKPNKIICPYCGGESSEYHRSWVLFLLNPIFAFMVLLDRKINTYRCKICKRFFNEKQRLHPETVKINHDRERAIKILKIMIFSAFVLWLVYNFVNIEA
jgi:hypothetical protein